MSISIGNWELQTVSGGRFALDGGAMFGVVPKPLWQRVSPADDRNRIQLGTNCVLARNGDHTLLIDTGYGGKLSDKEREIYAAEPGTPLLNSLARLGVGPEDIDIVVFSHLHFDHAGGGTQHAKGGEATPTFPCATYVAQAREWQDATGNSAELRGSYPLDNLLPISQSGQMRLIHGDEEIVPGLSALVTGGHTAGHHALVFRSSGATAVYLGDLCPTRAHLPSLWCMAYDVYPLDTRRRKPEILAQAVAEDWIVLWDHDPETPTSRIVADPRREFQAIDA